MKCRVKDCENHSDQGVFIGFLCMPCFTFLNTGDGIYSQLYRNTVAAEREACAIVCDKQANDMDEGDSWNNCANYLAKNIRARGQG